MILSSNANFMKLQRRLICCVTKCISYILRLIFRRLANTSGALTETTNRKIWSGEYSPPVVAI